jgi:hypothetical protein
MTAAKALAALAVTIDVSITALGGASSYELLAGGLQKRAQLSGPATVGDSVALANAAATVPVSLKFYDADGLISTCPRIDVAVAGGKPACRPRFVLTATQLGYRQFLCELTCETPPSGGSL